MNGDSLAGQRKATGATGAGAAAAPTPAADVGTTPSMRPHTTVILLVLSAIALGVRLILARTSGLSRDEGLFLFVARSDSWGSMVKFLQQQDSHPPLFYAIMRGWMSIAGHGDAAAQALPIALGVALVPAIFFIGARLFSVRVGIFAATFAALSPALAEHSVLARPYSFLPLAALLSSYTLIRGLDRGERRVWIAHSFTTLAILYTHNWGLLVLGGQLIAALLVLAVRRGPQRTDNAPGWALSQLAILAGYLLWVPSLLYQARNAGHAPRSVSEMGGIVAFVSEGVLGFLRATLVGYFPIDTSALLASAAAALLAVAVFFFAIRAANLSWMRRTGSWPTERRDAARLTGIAHDSRQIALIVLLVVPAAAWIAALILSPRSNLPLVRFLITLAPLIILSLSYWLGKEGTDSLKRLTLVAATLLMATNGATLYGLTRASRSNARELASLVSGQTRPTDLLIIAPEWLASSFNLYYPPSIEQINFPHFGREGAVSHSGIRDRTADPRAFARIRDRIAAARQAGRRIWLITDRDAVVDFSPQEIASSLNSQRYDVVGIVRANQIRTELISVYGQPDTVVAAEPRPTHFENLRAFVFTVGDRPK